MDYTEVNTIRTQYQAGLWPQFLQTLQIEGLRGWSGQSVELNFPVVAIVGENGSGKSTLMKVAACVYDNKDQGKRFYPSAFFVNYPLCRSGSEFFISSFSRTYFYTSSGAFRRILILGPCN